MMTESAHSGRPSEETASTCSAWTRTGTPGDLPRLGRTSWRVEGGWACGGPKTQPCSGPSTGCNTRSRLQHPSTDSWIGGRGKARHVNAFCRSCQKEFDTPTHSVEAVEEKLDTSTHSVEAVEEKLDTSTLCRSCRRTDRHFNTLCSGYT